MPRARWFLMVSFALAIIGMATWSMAQDRRAIAPDMKVLLENDCVRVQYHDVPVGGTIAMHSHPKYVVYTLKAFQARITLPDGSTRMSKREAGEVYWNESITHSVENLGTSDIHNLIMELKPGASCH